MKQKIKVDIEIDSPHEWKYVRTGSVEKYEYYIKNGRIEQWSLCGPSIEEYIILRIKNNDNLYECGETPEVGDEVKCVGVISLGDDYQYTVLEKNTRVKIITDDVSTDEFSPSKFRLVRRKKL